MKTFNSLAASLAAMALLGACGGSPAPSPVAGQPPVALADTVFSPPVPPVAPPDLPPLTRPAAVAHMALPSEERGPCLAGGTIRTVYPTMTVADIQALVASAANGDTILFKPGTYSMLSFEVRRRLQIIAEVPGETLLVGTTRPSTGWHDARNEKTDPKDTAQLHGAGILFRGIWPGGNSADGSCVSGLSMRFHEQAIRVEHAENILFENNRYESAFGDGLVLKDTKNMVVRNNQFLDPYLGVDDPGTLAAGFPDHRFDAQMDYGISVYGSINPRIHHNYFYGFFNQTVSFKNGNVDAYAADNTFEGSRLTALLFGQEPAASASDPADALTYQRYQSFTRDRGAMRASRLRLQLAQPARGRRSGRAGFEADVEAHQLALVRPVAAHALHPVRHRQAVRAAPAVAEAEQRQRVDEAVGLFFGVARVEDDREQAAGAGEVALPEFVAGAVLEGRMQHLGDFRPRLEPCRHLARGGRALEAQLHGRQAAQHEIRVVGADARAHHACAPARGGRCRPRSRVITAPISTSEPPDWYLVSACMTMSTPWSKPRSARPADQVLSSATSTPFSFAALQIAGRSGTSIDTEPGASVQISFVFGWIRSAMPAPISGS
jgi:hypothetical protein